jgi:hypothetical protein
MKISSAAWLRVVAVLSLSTLLTVGCQLGNQVNQPTSTGIAVAEKFAEFFDQHGGSAVFGAPISNSFSYEAEGKTVQYFQQLRLEIAPASNSVSVTPLGMFFWADRPVTPDAQVEGVFLEFYESHHGLAVLGAPLSNQMVEGERWVQYFQNGMLQWHPENPPSARVQIAELGQVHFWRSGAAQAYHAMARQFAPSIDASASHVEISGAVSAPILFSGDTQSLHLEVTTPEGYPAVAQTVEVKLVYNGEQHHVLVAQTDEDGQLHVNLSSPEAKPGQTITVAASVRSSSGRLLGQHESTYKVWW